MFNTLNKLNVFAICIGQISGPLTAKIQAGDDEAVTEGFDNLVKLAQGLSSDIGTTADITSLEGRLRDTKAQFTIVRKTIAEKCSSQGQLAQLEAQLTTTDSAISQVLENVTNAATQAFLKDMISLSAFALTAAIGFIEFAGVTAKLVAQGVSEDTAKEIVKVALNEPLDEATKKVAEKLQEQIKEAQGDTSKMITQYGDLLQQIAALKTDLAVLKVIATQADALSNNMTELKNNMDSIMTAAESTQYELINIKNMALTKAKKTEAITQFDSLVTKFKEIGNLSEHYRHLYNDSFTND